MAKTVTRLPDFIDARGNPDQSKAGEVGAGAVQLAHQSMAPAERIPGPLPLSPHIHPSGGVGGTIKGAEPPPVAQRGMGSAANGEAWFPDNASQLDGGGLTAGMPRIERAHQDTATTLPDGASAARPRADEGGYDPTEMPVSPEEFLGTAASGAAAFDQGSAAASPPPSRGGGAGAPTGFRPGAALDSPAGGAKNFGMESPGGTYGDLPAPYGSEFAERHVGVQATDLPVHDALSGLPQSISPEDFAKAALGGEYGTAWPPGLNGDKR